MESFDIIALTETWLDSDFGDHELQLADYNIYRKDRCHRRGGGVLLAIKNHLSCIHRTDLEVDAEMLALEIRLSPSTGILFSVFTDHLNLMILFWSNLENFLINTQVLVLSNLVVTGDFNYPHIDWLTGCASNSDHYTEEFCNLLDDSFLIQKNLHVTRGLGNPGSHGNILDLILTNNEHLIEDVSVHQNTLD